MTPIDQNQREKLFRAQSLAMLVMLPVIGFVVARLATSSPRLSKEAADSASALRKETQDVRRAAAIAAGRYVGIEAFAHRLFQGLVMFASGAGIFAAITWVLEGDIRQEEREVRKAALIESAFRAIDDISQRESTLRMSTRLAWAIDTLLRYEETVELEAKRIDLTGLKVVCGDVILRSAGPITLRETSLTKVRLVLDTTLASAEFAQADNSVIIGPPKTTARQDSSFAVSGLLRESTLALSGSTALDVVADRLTLNDYRIGSITLSGKPGPLLMLARDGHGPRWPHDLVVDLEKQPEPQAGTSSSSPGVVFRSRDLSASRVPGVPIFEWEERIVDPRTRIDDVDIVYGMDPTFREPLGEPKVHAVFAQTCPNGNCSPASADPVPKLNAKCVAPMFDEIWPDPDSRARVLWGYTENSSPDGWRKTTPLIDNWPFHQ